jgi:hypothetical protein
MTNDIESLTEMFASGIVGLISAVIYMIGFRYYMSGFMGDISQAAAASGVSGVIQKLGLALDTKGFIILGISLFFAILVALALSTILGVLAEDYQAYTNLTAPHLPGHDPCYFRSFPTQRLSLPFRSSSNSFTPVPHSPEPAARELQRRPLRILCTGCSCAHPHRRPHLPRTGAAMKLVPEKRCSSRNAFSKYKRRS